jgi:deoxyhypusine synthase
VKPSRRTTRYPPLDFTRITTYSTQSRPSKVRVTDTARPHRKGQSLARFLDSLPDILAARTLKAVIRDIVAAQRARKPVIVGMGAHPIKVGLNPILIDLMERGVISSLAMNGAGIIHDLELALVGKTSEEVEAGIDDGSFGMARDTAELLNGAIAEGAARGIGMGQAVGDLISRGKFPHKTMSLLATASRLNIPATVHVAIGTDIIHMHPSADGAAIGATSLEDFKRLTSVVAHLDGGVYLNLGSAVLLPEVFLKAVTIARNLGHRVVNFTTVNMDFTQHYRPVTNVVRRPTQAGGRGYTLTGHHEIMFPLLAAGVIEALGKRTNR